MQLINTIIIVAVIATKIVAIRATNNVVFNATKDLYRSAGHLITIRFKLIIHFTNNR